MDMKKLDDAAEAVLDDELEDDFDFEEETDEDDFDGEIDIDHTDIYFQMSEFLAHEGHWDKFIEWLKGKGYSEEQIQLMEDQG